MTSNNDTELKLDEKRLDRIKFYILKTERENLRTRAENNEQMIEKIRKIIEEEVKKCY